MTTLVLLALSAEKLVLFDFEKEADLRRWIGTEEAVEIDIVEEHASSGERALRAVVKRKHPWPGVRTERFFRDWRGFDVLRVDVYSRQERPIRFYVRIDDSKSGEGEHSIRYTKQFMLEPGMNLVEVGLPGLMADEGRRPIMLDAIRQLNLFTGHAAVGTTFYVDNVRLEKTDRPAVSSRRGPKAVSPGSAVVTLTTGRSFIGKVLEADEKGVRVRTAFASLDLKRSQIRSIEGPGREATAAVSLFRADFEDGDAARWSMGRIVRDERGFVIQGVMDEGRLRVRSNPERVRFTAGKGLKVCFRYLVSGPGEAIAMLLCGGETMVEAAVPVRVRGRWQAAELSWSEFHGVEDRRKPAEMQVGLLNWFLEGAAGESRFLLDEIEITAPRRGALEESAAFAGRGARSFVPLDSFETNNWRSTKANCRVALDLSSRFRHGGRHSLMFHKAEKVIHDGRISRSVRLPRGAKGVRFWVMKGGDEAPVLGIGLQGGDAHFGFDSKELNAALAALPKGAWRQVEVSFDTSGMTVWPHGRDLDWGRIDTLVISVGDNETRKEFGRVLYIDDMELILGPGRQGGGENGNRPGRR